MKKYILNLIHSIIIVAVSASCSMNDFSLGTEQSGPFTPPLTTIGYIKMQQDIQDRRMIADRLFLGLENPRAYNTGICYEEVAFVRFLYDNTITKNDLTNFTKETWLYKFNFAQGEQWDGHSSIARGEILGFRNELDNKFFHTAIATGYHDEIRSVDGEGLGNDWEPISLSTALGYRNADGTFNFEGRRINTDKI